MRNLLLCACLILQTAVILATEKSTSGTDKLDKAVAGAKQLGNRLIDALKQQDKQKFVLLYNAPKNLYK
jgi:hypothetical protein